MRAAPAADDGAGIPAIEIRAREPCLGGVGRVHLRYLAASGPTRRHSLLHGILRPGGPARALFRQARRAANARAQGGAHRSRRTTVPVAAVLSRQTLVSGAFGVCLSPDRRHGDLIVTSSCMTQTDESVELMNRSSYSGLPERFFARVNPVPVAKPRLLRFNHALGAELGLDIGGLGRAGRGGLFFG